MSVEVVAPQTIVNGSGPRCVNCGKAGDRKNSCPKCLEMGIRDSIFCTAQCFKDNWKTHKKLHQVAGPGSYVFPPAEDGLKDIDGQKYTGALRAVYPVPRVPTRIVPSDIPRPDYADNSEALLSIPTRWSGVWGGSVWGKAEEVGRVIGYGLKGKGESFLETMENKSRASARIHSAAEIASMRKVCKLAREVLDIAAAALRPGITTLELDELVHAECLKRKSYPSPLNYHLFPRSVCTSVNEVICHGIPDARPLEDGDIINLDVTLYHEGFHGDVNATYPVGANVSQQNRDLIAATRGSLDEAIRICKPGTLFKDVGGVIEPFARDRGFSTNRTYVGHGINQLFHCAPNIAHYEGSSQTTGKMKAGMIFTIEPMICTGVQQDKHWKDNWTSVTADGKPSAQFEETLLITEKGVEVLTAAPGWVLPPKPARYKAPSS